jgi:predicted RNA-binding Zn-ribbon protein involved in translation (DUF1610 family)
MKSQPYICPGCGKPEEIQLSWWQRLWEKYEWKCPHCGERLESTIERGPRYRVFTSVLLASYVAGFFLVGFKNSGYLFVLVIVKFIGDLTLFRQKEITPVKVQTLSKSEMEEPIVPPCKSTLP